MSWLVIGGTGFVGSALTTWLRREGASVATLTSPRLVASTNADAATLWIQAAESREVPELAEQLGGFRTVVLAAGSATPDAPWSDGLVGANALLPAVVALACHAAGVSRFLHVSSAAVQGRRHTLDETPVFEPFSPYSRSKMLGEQVLLEYSEKLSTEVVVLRATSVQGPNRSTTKSLRRIARSRLASVCGDGGSPSAVSSIDSLCAYVQVLGDWPTTLPSIVLQPWEGLSTAEVLRIAGGREPLHLPETLCSMLLRMGWSMSRLTGDRFSGSIRRVEAMWCGQAVDSSWAKQHEVSLDNRIQQLLTRPDDA